MDGQRFDAIARGFAARLTRRRAVAGALGLAVAAIGAGDAEAAVRPTCRAYGAGCNRSSQCCAGRCDTRRTSPRSRRNRCTCPVGLTICGGVCVDLQIDETHCGQCGNACASGATCLSGECICPDGEIVCGNACAPLGTEANCLACGDVCDANQRCCGARGCIDLGTDNDCIACDDACAADADGFDREFCNGGDGCQTACKAGAGGFVTTDWPPLTFLTPDVDNFNFARYGDPDGSSLPYTACQTSADCGACPASFLNGSTRVTVVGCGCVKASCHSWGGVDTHFYNWNPNFPADTYACAVFYDDPGF